ncbi:MAG: ribosome maturation factor RimM [Alphaproteobacteria bacterium]|nr:ribosome maturation factor RimM [Alphaproteobacteria bacterium]
MSTGPKICVGQFAGAHGVRGLVKLRSFTAEQEAIFDYAPLIGEDGKRTFKIAPKSAVKDMFIVSVEGIENKEAADQLRGDKIFIPHSLLPKTRKNEFYEADLIGLKAIDAEGKNYGSVLGVFDFGGGTFLEIGQTKKDSFMLPFKDAFVPTIDVKAGKMVIVVPEDWI